MAKNHAVSADAQAPKASPDTLDFSHTARVGSECWQTEWNSPAGDRADDQEGLGAARDFGRQR
jgi:hypothetical protein